MVEGLAEYAEPGVEPIRIYLGEEAIKNMNASFQGKPVYVDHVDEVNLENLEKEMDGVVVRSFFNKLDGKNWVEFVVTTDRGKEAIRSGWKLSNAYVPKNFAQGGENHGVSYDKEVISGEYEHLAIVQNPRYEESVILSPEEFKQYNEKKEKELSRFANSKNEKETKKMAFKFNLFKRTKVENGKDVDLSSLMVELPKSKSEILLSEVVEKYDTIQNMKGYANDDHMVKVGDKEMNVKDLRDGYMKACNDLEEMKKKNSDEEGSGQEDEEMENDESQKETVSEGMKDVGSRGGDVSLENEEEEVEKKEKMMKDKKKNASDKASALKNAGAHNAPEPQFHTIEIGIDKVARGKQRYGSGN